jgi:hypothetical protein
MCYLLIQVLESLVCAKLFAMPHFSPAAEDSTLRPAVQHTLGSGAIAASVDRRRDGARKKGAAFAGSQTPKRSLPRDELVVLYVFARTSFPLGGLSDYLRMIHACAFFQVPQQPEKVTDFLRQPFRLFAANPRPYRQLAVEAV